MRFALRPYIIAGVAIAGASALIFYPATPTLPDIEVPAVQPAGSEVSGLNQPDPLDVLGIPEVGFSAPDGVSNPSTVVLAPSGGSPSPGGLPTPAIAPPDLSPLDLNGFDLGGLDLNAEPSPGNVPPSP
jgi:hypothetical protein